MDPDVVEIPPPATSHSIHRKPKHKQVMPQEVIDIDNDEDFADVMVLDEVIDTKDKGKAITDYPDGINPEDFFIEYFEFPKSLADVPLEPNDMDGSGCAWSELVDYAGTFPPVGGDSFTDGPDNDMGFDECETLQVTFDDVNIPPGVAPKPWCGDVGGTKKKNDAITHSSGASGHMKSGTGSKWFSKLAHFNKKPKFVSASGSKTKNSASPLPSPASGEGLNSQINNNIHGLQHGAGISNGSTNHTLHGHTFPTGIETPYKGLTVHNQQNTFNNLYFPNFTGPMGGLNYQPPMGPTNFFPANFPPPPPFFDPFNPVHKPLDDGAPRNPIDVEKLNGIQRRFQLIKRFDTVEDHSDHFYNSQGSFFKQPPKSWAKRIQEEWRILENDLPEAIFVRVYETRMDLLRAVIVGADGTPYHDGLFFFDIFFPSHYPDVPPLVHYHSGGLRINPNLYSCGKVCLSLLGTWQGRNNNERWLPGVSTVLQVLVSIQALILNQKPFFNEPGYEKMSGQPHGEKRSLDYNENTFILSLKTMVYSMRRPPKHFEDIVIGHFRKRARDILVACKAYMEGAQVGCLVKGGVQDVDEGDKSCSLGFKNSLPGCVDMLLKEFALIRAENIGEFESLVRRTNSGGHVWHN